MSTAAYVLKLSWEQEYQICRALTCTVSVQCFQAIEFDSFKYLSWHSFSPFSIKSAYDEYSYGGYFRIEASYSSWEHLLFITYKNPIYAGSDGSSPPHEAGVRSNHWISFKIEYLKN
jgi:hypothetical protein